MPEYDLTDAVAVVLALGIEAGLVALGCVLALHLPWGEASGWGILAAVGTVVLRSIINHRP